jgi:hypothetical protein
MRPGVRLIDSVLFTRQALGHISARNLCTTHFGYLYYDSFAFFAPRSHYCITRMGLPRQAHHSQHSKNPSLTTMAVVWQRHPRYSLFIFITLALTLYLLGPYQSSPPQSTAVGRAWPANDLPTRLARSEHIYQVSVFTKIYMPPGLVAC